MLNLLLRSVSGSIYAALVLISCFSGAYGQIFLAGFLGASAIIEWLQFRSEKHISLPASLMIGILFLSLYSFSGAFYISPEKDRMLLFIMTLLFLILMISQVFIRSSKVPDRIFHMVFGLVYIGFAMFLIPQISIIQGVNNPWILASIFILIWCSDTFAYLVGRFFGKRKLIERISPNKTWEGFFGGMIFTFVGAVVLGIFLDIFPLWSWLGLALVVVIFSTTGDLFESALKRAFNLKDSGRFLPGHGGILDRIDSLLFVLPVAYFYLRIIANNYL